MKSSSAIAASIENEASSALVWGLSTREGAILATILVATALIYMPSIGYGWIWDDKAEIVQKSALQSWAGIGRSFIYDSWWFHDPDHLPQSAYYRPLQLVWFALNYMILGVHPAAWHFEKVVLELIGVILCFRLAQLVTKNTAIALLTAAIFGLLPANVDAVVWNSAIPEPLSAILEMGAMCCFIQRKPGWSRGVVFALMLYAGALLSHETAVLFWIVVAAYLFLIEGKRPGEAIRKATPFALLSVAYLFARWNALGAEFFGRPDFVRPSVALGWEAPHPPYGWLDLMLTAPVALLTYLEALVVPGIAGPTHDVNWVTRASEKTFVSAGVLVALVLIALALIRRSRDRNLYLFCAVWGLMAIAPAMNLKALAVLVEDRILYASSIAWSLALAVVAVRLGSNSTRARRLVAGAMALLLAAYAITALQIEPYWHDDVTYFRACVAIAPHKPEYIRELVDQLNDKGDLTGAMKVLQGALNRDEDNVYLHVKLAAQYAMMQRGPDFLAETRKVKQLRMEARVANGVAVDRGVNPTGSPR